MGRPEKPEPRDLKKKITPNLTQWDCYNLFAGVAWTPTSTGDQNGTGRTLGDCEHYDDTEYQRELEQWEDEQYEANQ